MIFLPQVLKTHILPHVATKRRALLLRNTAFLWYVLFLTIFVSSTRFIAFRFPEVLGYASNINVSDLFKYTNAEREKDGLKTLSLNPVLSKAAEAKARDMFTNNYWAHVSPKGVEPWYFFGQVGYDYTFAGENLAKNFNDSKSVVRAWMNSPSHKDNMLNSNYSEIGLAVVNGELNGYKTTLVVQFFGARRALGERPQVSGESAVEVPLQLAPSLPEPKVQTNEPLIDVFVFTRWSMVVLSAFIVFLFTLDIWYSAKNGIIRVSGNAIAHMFVLVLAIISLAVVMVPGRVG